MSESIESRTILVDALLAGHTLLTRRDHQWIAQEIQSEGRLGQRRPLTADPAEQGWRGGGSR